MICYNLYCHFIVIVVVVVVVVVVVIIIIIIYFFVKLIPGSKDCYFLVHKHKAAAKKIEAKRRKRLRRRFMWCSLCSGRRPHSPLESYGQALEQECRFPVVLCHS